MADEATYEAQVSEAFGRIIAAADRLDPDLLEADATSDMITLTSSSGEKCVINTQRAVGQLWVAARGEGIHFNWDPAQGAWRDDRGRGLELFAFVDKVVEELCGQRLGLGSG